MSAPPTIEMINVSRRYGGFEVLESCSLAVAKGEVVVVCGPSGSGKSTLIECVNGLEPFQEGRITVGGLAVGDPKVNLPRLRARVGMVFQHFELFPHLDIEQNIVLAQRIVEGAPPAEVFGATRSERARRFIQRILHPGGL